MINKFGFEPKTKPYEYQLEAVQFLEGEKNRALFDEQGLGKSKMIIDTLCRDIKNGIINGALIVCKKTLTKTWQNEIAKHSFIPSIIFEGTKYQRLRSLTTFSYFYIVNYETLISDIEIVRSLLKIRQMAIVLDESHKIKNPDSNIFKNIISLKDLAKKRIIISGTPIANKPEDIWAQFYFLDDGETLGSNFKEFQKKVKTEIGIKQKKVNENELNWLREAIRPLSLRRTKGELKELVLPEKEFIDVFVDLEKNQRKLYDKARDELLVEIKRTSEEEFSDEIENILKKMLRLIQISSNPLLLDVTYSYSASKLKKMDDLVKEIIQKNEKVIIWTSFVDNVTNLKKRYKNLGVVSIYGNMTMDERNNAVEDFQRNENIKVMIAVPAAAREGLTLTAANNAIYLDRNFNLVDYLQSQDRIHRISQKKRCKIFKLIGKDTIDEYVDEVLLNKLEIASYIHGDKPAIELRNILTKEKILKMLGGTYGS
jgi:SWI/SNF-related matrix-associated actin-dependent regulator 1 of chromatin subfamily A